MGRRLAKGARQTTAVCLAPNFFIKPCHRGLFAALRPHRISAPDLARCSRQLRASHQNHLLVFRDSSTSSMADSISAASARVRGWDRLALLGSTDTASMFTTDW